MEKSFEIKNTYSSLQFIGKKEHLSSGFLLFKKVVDVVGAMIGIVITLPIIIVLGIIVKITTKGSVIYMHERIGQYGKAFRIYKIRSMYTDAEHDGPRLSSKSDLRITPVGRFMRRWRLDEIPNLINVMKGEMSLVGPRPERQCYIDQIVTKSPEFTRLLQFKPGVTSLGEVRFGYAENVEEMIIRMRYDLFYTENISIWMDFLILARTINVILKGKGV